MELNKIFFGSIILGILLNIAGLIVVVTTGNKVWEAILFIGALLFDIIALFHISTDESHMNH